MFFLSSKCKFQNSGIYMIPSICFLVFTMSIPSKARMNLGDSD
jgi:hypothetical protein